MPNARAMSPMLRHALESLEHGVFHYLDGTEVGRKFALLHLDHAIELLLKEKVASLGTSIYRKDGKTIGVYEAYTALDNHGVPIPEKARLEDLHDFRSIVQHKGLSPDRHTTQFYVVEAYEFVKRFLCESLGVRLADHVPRALINAMEKLGPEESEVAELVRERLLDAESLFASGAHEMAVVSAFTGLEIAVRSVSKVSKPCPVTEHFRQLIVFAKIDRNLWDRFRSSVEARNLAAHTSTGLSRATARRALDDMNEIVSELWMS